MGYIEYWIKEIVEGRPLVNVVKCGLDKDSHY